MTDVNGRNTGREIYDGTEQVAGEYIRYRKVGDHATNMPSAVWFGLKREAKEGLKYRYDASGNISEITQNGHIAAKYAYDALGRLIKQSDGLEFIYDHSGIAGVKYNGNIYFYRKDTQGNIMALLDSNGAVVVEYKYDAWGNHEAEVTDEEYVALAEKNPYRYRGYYFDEESGLYFLQTRYYDPETGRFISRDSIEYADPEAINGLNLYAYCGNNPVMNVDPTGTFVIGLLVLGTAVGGVVGGVASYNSGKRGWAVVGDVILGMALGLAAAGAIVATIAVAVGAVAGITTMILGLSVKTAFAIGALAFDFTAFVVMPLYGIDMQGIEFEMPQTPNTDSPQTSGRNLQSTKRISSSVFQGGLKINSLVRNLLLSFMEIVYDRI
mgnify:CR=1 FL=1